MARAFIAGTLLVVLISGVLSEPLRKQLGGPPEEFADHILPQPWQAAVEEKSASIRVVLSKGIDAAGLSATVQLPVDDTDLFAFSVFSDVLPALSLSLKTPSGASLDLPSHAHPGNYPLSDDESSSVPGTTFIFPGPNEKPQPAGVYVLSIECDTCVSADSQKVAVHLFNDDQIRVHTHLSTYNTFVGQPIGLVSLVTVDPKDGRRSAIPNALPNTVTTAVMDVLLPNGGEVAVPMHDDGLEGDAAANDGIFTAVITATVPGDYVASAMLSGEVNGVKFLRSTEQIITVIVDDIELSGKASAVVVGTRATINIGVNANTQTKYRAYAEVWGTKDGALVPVAWISGAVNTVALGTEFVLPLGLDLQWVAKAGAAAPFTLKNVVVQDMNVFLPMAQAAQIPVSVSGDIEGVVKHMSLKVGIETEITDEMRWGVAPAHIVAARRTHGNLSAAAVPMVMSHGYCTERNPFEVHSEFFTDAYYFHDFKANRRHDVFATLVAAYAEAQELTIFSGVGHSQGGPVMVHLFTFYWSGLDVLTGGRPIQALASPWVGCTGAGSAANLIKIFGVGCGMNFDLTVDGSELWLATIPRATREKSYYYTATYKRNQFFGDYCNVAVNLVLEWPNDGTTELDYAILQNGVNLGNTEQQCHTTGMKYKPIYDDAVRSKAINDNRGT